MDSFLLHPKLVHMPIALAVLMPLVSGGIALAWWRGWLPARAWFIAVALQGVLVGSSVLAIQTGEIDEERVEQVVDERFIEEHEDAAKAFLWASAAVFGVMLLGALPKFGKGGATAATLGTVAVLWMGYRVGQSGGGLVYQHGAAAAHLSAAGSVGEIPATSEDHDYGVEEDD